MSPQSNTPTDAATRRIGIVVLTYNRVHILRQCVENVLGRVSSLTHEVVIVDNASTDGTYEYLKTVEGGRIRVLRNERNRGQNAYRAVFARMTTDYLCELDDDVIDAPPEWDRALVEAFERVPSLGFLAANLVDNEHDLTARIMYGPSAHAYRIVERDGVRLKVGGAVGGWCALTSREIYERVGGFRQDRKYVFWQEEAAYIAAIRAIGYKAAILDDLKVLHAGGDYYAPPAPEKERYWADHFRRRARRRRVKQLLLHVPFVAALNARFRWFVPPA